MKQDQKQDMRMIPLTDVLTSIHHADDAAISQIISAVIQRYEVIFPDWEISFLSLPKHEPERSKAIDETITFIRNHIA